MFRVGFYQIAVPTVRMTVWCEQLRMVERSCLCDCPRVRQAVPQEINEVGFFLQSETKYLHVRIHELNFFNCVEVATAVVELNHLLQRQLAAVMEVRGCQANIPKLRRFEESAACNVVIAVHRRGRDTISAASWDNHSLVS